MKAPCRGASPCPTRMSSFRRAAESPKLLRRRFGGRTKRGRQTNLLQHAEHVMKSGLVEEPAWLEAMRQCVAWRRCTRRQTH